MANASTAHEPSMEEILASIRQIISEDGEAAAGPGQAKEIPRAEALAPAPPPEREPEPELEPKDESNVAYGEFMKPQSSASPAKSGAQAFEPDAPADVSPRQDIAAVPFRNTSTPPPRAKAAEENHLLSDQSDVAVAGAFSALAHTILAQNARTLEDLVAEMLKPMLKEWLDDNLPQLVERLVQEEIHRVSRGRR